MPPWKLQRRIEMEKSPLNEHHHITHLAKFDSCLIAHLKLPIFFLSTSTSGDDNLHRCSISADSRIENSGSEDSTDDENIDMRDNGYHDAENEVDPDTEDDPERVHSGKLSESSGYAGSDLYDYKLGNWGLFQRSQGSLALKLAGCGEGC
ncbi:Rho GTPase-activating protein 7 [Vitis vinifera]|uniref:Rho GTPase-activating protein 7 n=1 Tax=Vitis vinifera TaxID=29760 RepID=A0A438KFP5_VITVI|nr:Rho GTPase-activating protein 7 [Vitis vinifera]